MEEEEEEEERSKWVPVTVVLQLSLDHEHFVGASDFSNIPGYKLGNKKKRSFICCDKLVVSGKILLLVRIIN